MCPVAGCLAADTPYNVIIGHLVKYQACVGVMQEQHTSVNPSNAEANFCSKQKDAPIFENHLNPVILVFIRELWLSTLI